jgi:putative membrane protein
VRKRIRSAGSPFTRLAVGLPLALGGLVAWPSVAWAHGYAPDPGSLGGLLLQWRFDWYEVLPLVLAAVLYRMAERRVAREHPAKPHPRWRAWCWYGGLAVLYLALQSPIGVYDTTFFSVHMVQHLMMAMIAAPLLALGAPITLLLRGSSARTRQRWILPVLHSWPLRIAAFPVVTWTLFAGVMWASHFSSLYDAALENELIHLAEHVLYMGAALLFWWPAVGADPSPWRLSHPVRIGYLFLGMPQSSFLGLAILSAPAILYPHYATVTRSWGPTPLADQQLAGGLMWVVGDAVFLIALILAVWVWLRAEDAEGRRVDARLDRERAQAERAAARTEVAGARAGRADPAAERAAERAAELP